MLVCIVKQINLIHFLEFRLLDDEMRKNWCTSKWWRMGCIFCKCFLFLKIDRNKVYHNSFCSHLLLPLILFIWFSYWWIARTLKFTFLGFWIWALSHELLYLVSYLFLLVWCLVLVMTFLGTLIWVSFYFWFQEWLAESESPLLETLYKALDEVWFHKNEKNKLVKQVVDMSVMQVVKLAESEIYSYSPEPEADPFLERGAMWDLI